MYDIRVVFSLCFLFAAFILNSLTTLRIINKNKYDTNKTNLYIPLVTLCFHSLYAYIAILLWFDWNFVNVGAPFALIYGPLLWHFTLMNKDRSHLLQNIKWHFSPFIIFTIGYIYGLTSPDNKVFIKYYTKYLYIFAGIQFAIYLVLSITNTSKIKPVEDKNHQIKTTFFSYLYLLSAITIFLFLSTNIDRLLISKDQPEKEIWSYSVHLLILSVSILLHLGITNNWHFIRFKSIIKSLENNRQAQDKYKTTKNKSSYLKSIAKKIENVPDDTYKNADLNLQSFAELIKEPPHLISQTFSTELNTNFNQYTNQIRLKFATNLLLTQPDSTIADIAFKSGFNSEASFYRIFKAHYQTTPRKYQDSHKQ